MYKPIDVTRLCRVVIELKYNMGPSEKWGFDTSEEDAWKLLRTFEEIRKKAYQKAEEEQKSCEYKQYLALQKKFGDITEEEYRKLMNCDKKDEERLQRARDSIYPPGSYL